VLNELNKENICKETVFAQVYQDLITPINNFIYYKFGSKENAEDISQNAFIKLWENCAKLSIKEAKSFLYKTAINMSLNVVKHEKVKLNFNTTPQKSITNETPEYELIGKEFQEKLQHTIASLPEKQREVFLLNRIEKMKYAEIAILLDISVKAVEKRMHGALLILREKIGKV